jgi:hypothetical protein
MTITWGDISFEGPYAITAWNPPRRAAVYAIMYKRDRSEDRYFIIYFGESENLSYRGFYRSHHKYNCWIQYAGSDDNLYIGINTMPNSTDAERRRVEQDLIRQYDPYCNR